MNLKSTLLQAKELAVCQELAKRRDLHGRRAQALLALEAGGSQSDAAASSGLSAGQVKYALYQFRQRRLEIFPAELRTTAKATRSKVGPSARSTASINGPTVADEPAEALPQEQAVPTAIPIEPDSSDKKKKKKKKNKKSAAKLKSKKKKKKKKKAPKAETESKPPKKKKKKKKKKAT